MALAEEEENYQQEDEDLKDKADAVSAAFSLEVIEAKAKVKTRTGAKTRVRARACFGLLGFFFKPPALRGEVDHLCLLIGLLLSIICHISHLRGILLYKDSPHVNAPAAFCL